MQEHLNWKKFDLHIHTLKKEDSSLDHNKTISIDKNNVEEFGKKLEENNIKLISITNHNYFDFNNYKLIKNEVENNKGIKILPGVEVNSIYNENKFQMNLIFKDVEEEELEKEWNKNFSEDLNEYIKIENILKFLVAAKREVLMSLDVAKSSTKIKKGKIFNQNPGFLYYFDFFEGNEKFEQQKWLNQMEIFSKEKGISKSKSSNCVFGTDNINFNDYPNRDERKGWTGTFFAVDPDFDSLKICSFFRHFVLKEEKNGYINSKEDPKYLPNLEEIKINFVDNILLDRGLNVIYGKRGTGKSHFLSEIKKEIEEKNLNNISRFIGQSEISNIVVEMANDETKYIESNTNNILKKKEWTSNIIKDQIETSSKNFFQLVEYFINNFTEKTWLEKEIGKIYNDFENLIVYEIENKSFDEEQEIISIINTFFSTEFNKKIFEAVNSLKNLSDLKITDNKISTIISKNLNVENIKKETKLYINKELKNIKFANLKNNIEKKTNHELISNINKIFFDINKRLELNKNFFLELKKTIFDIFENPKEKFLTLKQNSEYFFAYIQTKANFSEKSNFIDSLGRNMKLKNLDKIIKKDKIKDIILGNYEFNKNYSKDFENEILGVKWIYKLENLDISTLSPGERVEKYFKRLLTDTRYKIILIDQPEDQLDSQTTNDSIIEPIAKQHKHFIEKGVQIIFVSHDPKLIINTGPVNFVKISKENEKYNRTNLTLSEFIKKDENINVIDGKKEYVHLRSDLYGKKSN